MTASLGGDRTDFDGVAVQNAGYGGILARLLVQRGKSRLVGSIQTVNLLTHHEGELGTTRYALASAFGGCALHVPLATHGVSHLAGKGLLASSGCVKIGKCNRQE